MLRYADRKQAKIDSLRARAAEIETQSDSLYQAAKERAERIPFGQPILVGHHSEGRDRRFRDKIRQGYGKAFELQGEAERLRRRADATENSRAVSSLSMFGDIRPPEVEDAPKGRRPRRGKAARGQQTISVGRFGASLIGTPVNQIPF
jgi:hypothetical protein